MDRRDVRQRNGKINTDDELMNAWEKAMEKNANTSPTRSRQPMNRAQGATAHRQDRMQYSRQSAQSNRTARTQIQIPEFVKSDLQERKAVREQEATKNRNKRVLEKRKRKKRRRFVRRVNLFFVLFLVITTLIYKIAVPAMVKSKSDTATEAVVDTGVNYTDTNPSSFLTVVSGEKVPVMDYLDNFTTVSHRELKMQKDENGIYSLMNNSTASFNVLQLTDLHIGGSEDYYKQDIEAVNAVYNLVQRTHPDFIVMTGDVVFGMPYKSVEDTMSSLDIVIKMMDKIGIPWTWTFGNHDHNFFDNMSSEETEQLLSQSKTLYMYPDNPEITGYSNGVIKLCNKDGSLNTALVLLDSNASIYAKEGDPEPSDYDYIRQDQVDWYESQIKMLNTQEKNNVKSMLFFHIPVQEYVTAWNLYQDGDSSATYQFGAKREDSDCSSMASSLFTKAVELGSTEAMFCGHDHLNDYAVTYHGVELVYGKSIDYAAYTGIESKTEQRGANLIRIANDSSYNIYAIRLAE